jgi:hypothetical protein
VHLPEIVEEPRQRHDCGIKLDANHLGMGRRVVADLLVGRVRFPAAGIAAGDSLHAGQQLVGGIGAPKTTATHDDRFGFGFSGVHGGRKKRKGAQKQSKSVHRG